MTSYTLETAQCIRWCCTALNAIKRQPRRADIIVHIFTRFLNFLAFVTIFSNFSQFFQFPHWVCLVRLLAAYTAITDYLNPQYFTDKRCPTKINKLKYMLLDLSQASHNKCIRCFHTFSNLCLQSIFINLCSGRSAWLSSMLVRSSGQRHLHSSPIYNNFTEYSRWCKLQTPLPIANGWNKISWPANFHTKYATNSLYGANLEERKFGISSKILFISLIAVCGRARKCIVTTMAQPYVNIHIKRVCCHWRPWDLTPRRQPQAPLDDVIRFSVFQTYFWLSAEIQNYAITRSAWNTFGKRPTHSIHFAIEQCF